MAKKHLGQNWLVDKNIINKIKELAKITNKINVIEIGSGHGALTKFIIENSKKHLCIEIDKDLCSLLSKKYKKINLICNDYLSLNIDKVIEENFQNEDVMIISNLPYYITSKIIFKNIECEKIFKQILMVQKEYGQRIIETNNSKKFGRLTVSINTFNDTKKLIDVKKNSFFPIPSIDSMLIEITKKEKFKINNKINYLNFIKIIFNNKRKTIYNNLLNYLENKDKTGKILKELKIDSKKRPQELSIEQLIAIWNTI